MDRPPVSEALRHLGDEPRRRRGFHHVQFNTVRLRQLDPALAEFSAVPIKGGRRAKKVRYRAFHCAVPELANRTTSFRVLK